MQREEQQLIEGLFSRLNRLKARPWHAMPLPNN